MRDVGSVTEENGVLGVRATFKKRYITLAPVAGIVGLAFNLKVPACFPSVSPMTRHVSVEHGALQERALTQARRLPRLTPWRFVLCALSLADVLYVGPQQLAEG